MLAHMGEAATTSGEQSYKKKRKFTHTQTALLLPVFSSVHNDLVWPETASNLACGLCSHRILLLHLCQVVHQLQVGRV